MAYTPAQTAAMNKQGTALLKSKAAGTYHPPTPTPAKPKVTAPAYTTPQFTQPAAPKAVVGTSAGRESWNTTPTVVEQEKPAWLANAEKTNPGSGGMSYNRTNKEGYADNYLKNIQDALKSDQEKQNEAMLAGLRGTFDQNRNNLTAQKPAIQQKAQDLRNDVDTTFFQSLPGLYQTMESTGQRGGENITGRVALETTRGQGQNAAGLYELNGLQNISNALLNLDSQQATAEASAAQGISSDALAMNLSEIKNAMSLYETQQAQAKNDFNSTIGAYSSDYQAQINKLLAAGYSADSYEVKALQAQRNAKLENLRAAAIDAEQQQFENALAQQKTDYTTSKPYYKPSSGSGDSVTYAEAIIAYNAGDRSDAVLTALGLK